eukprot:3797376-Pyramimonas_sp.AAC.1
MDRLDRVRDPGRLRPCHQVEWGSTLIRIFVARRTEKEDMITDEGRRPALDDIKKFKGKHIALWGSMPCTGGFPWQYVNEAL